MADFLAAAERNPELFLHIAFLGFFAVALVIGFAWAIAVDMQNARRRRPLTRRLRARRR